MTGTGRRAAGAVAALALALGVAACGGDSEGLSGTDASHDYPQQVRANFVNACAAQPGAKRATCQCTLDEIQSKLTYDEFKRADSETRLGTDVDPRARKIFADAIADCTD